jgi:hypothetical protein
MSTKQYTAKSSFSNCIYKIQHLSNNIAKVKSSLSLRKWLDNIEISDRNLAHKLCKLIPSQCPFEREIKLLGHTIVSIPPLCKLNPFYEEVVALRFRAICYLADKCGEDVSSYC